MINIDKYKHAQQLLANSLEFWIYFFAAWKHTHLAIVAIFFLLLTMILDSFPAAPDTAVDCGQKNKFDQAPITIIQLQHNNWSTV
jgi:hypothetical protein